MMPADFKEAAADRGVQRSRRREEDGMSGKCHIRNGLWVGLVLLMSSVAASAIPAPIARMGTASKTIMQKTFDGAKSVAKVPVHVVRYGAIGAKDVGVSVVHRARSI